MKLTNCVLLSAMLAAPLVRAEETVRWADLPKFLEEAKAGRSREYTVVTKAGEKKRMQQLLISPPGLQLRPDGPIIPPGQVLEIQVRHRGRLSYFGWLEGKRPCGPNLICPPDPIDLLILPFDLAYGAAATPPMLVVEGVRLMPAKILKIAP